MTFKILSDKSYEIIHYSNIRPANVPFNKNVHLILLIIPIVIKSKRDLSDNAIVSTTLSTVANNDSLNSLTPMPIFDISNLVERTFLMPANKNR